MAPMNMTEAQLMDRFREKLAKRGNRGIMGLGRSFKIADDDRSGDLGMEEFQKGRESGQLDYNMPVFNAKEKLRKGLIKEEDIPYMQRRGGRPDNKDTKSGVDPMPRTSSLNSLAYS